MKKATENEAPIDEPSATRASLPNGYFFVPKGNVFITGNCRRHTQALCRPVYVVFRYGDMKERIGIGVPTYVYLKVQFDERNTRAERASNTLKRDDNIAREFEEAIMKEFPHIPTRDMTGILEKALEKSKGKVGRTSTLDITNKTILAVRAYIRHQHTDYDKLLRGGMDRDEARREVAAKVRETDKAWSRIESGVPRREAKKRQLLRTAVGRRPTSSPKPSSPLPKRVKATTSKLRPRDRQLTEMPARNTLPNETDMTDRSGHTSTPVGLTKQGLDDTRRRKILNVITKIQGLERKIGNGKSERSIKRRNSVLKYSNIMNKLLEEVGLQRVETSGARGNLAKQLRLTALDPTDKAQITTRETTSTHQMKTRRSSSQGTTLAVGREREFDLENAGNFHTQRAPLNKTKVVIDLTGESDDDNVASAHINSASQHNRNREALRVRGVAWRRGSDATAREVQRELRELGAVGGTGEVLPRKIHAAAKADRILSKHFHSHKVN